MKKLLILVAFAVVCLFPVVANADVVRVNDEEVPAGAYGTFKAGDIVYEYTDTSNGLKEWKFYLTAGSDLENVYVSLQPIKLTIQSIKEGNSFVIETKKTVQSDGTTEVFLRTEGVKKGNRVLLLTVVTKDDKDSNGCELNISPKVLTCLNTGSSWFDQNGNELNNKEEYDAVCSNVGPTDKPLEDVPNNSETGIPVPYIALGGGLVALAGVYFLNKKNTKMFKL